MRFEQISPLDTVRTLGYSDLQLLLAELEKQADRISGTARTLASCSEKDVLTSLRPSAMLQAVQLICQMLGGVESLELREACDKLKETCAQYHAAKGNEDPAGRLRPEIVEEVGERYAMVTLSRAAVNFDKFAVEISDCLRGVKGKVEELIRTYARTFRVDFELGAGSDLSPGEVRTSTAVQETLLVRACCVHRLEPGWKYQVPRCVVLSSAVLRR